MKKILIIQTASIGDVILATPVAECMHQQEPETIIDILVKKGCESLFAGHPFIRNVLVWDKSSKKYRHLFSLLKKIRREKFDAVINIQRFASSGFLAGFSGAAVRSGFDKNPFSFLFTHKATHSIGTGTPFVHEAVRNLALLKPLFGECLIAVPRLYPTEAAYAKAAEIAQGRYITIAPASLWFTKQWPAEKWAEFISEVPAEIKIFITGSGSDNMTAEKIVNLCRGNKPENLCGKLSLLETAALMKDAEMNFTNDSAPQHLASAVNAAVSVVFCSTVPAFGFGPLSDKSTIIETAEPLKCRPCGLHGFNSCPEKHFKCAMAITKEQLLKSVKQ
jgi:heptosyltransferase-2